VDAEMDFVCLEAFVDNFDGAGAVSDFLEDLVSVML